MRFGRARADRARRVSRARNRRVYELGWSAAVLLAVTVGSAATILVNGWTVLLTEAVGMTLTGVLSGACLETRPGGWWSLVRTWGLGTGATTVALVGLSEVVGPASLPVVLAGWATHPLVVRWVIGRLRRDERVGGTVDALSDDELEHRWRRTGAVVRSSWSTPAEAARLVEVRASILDELERRDPDRVERWLAGREGR